MTIGQTYMKFIGAVLSFILGAVFGSFANVLIYRIPRGESIVFPGSHCPVCGHPLSWKDNIPLISYILLKGRCRYCGARISPRYPLVEFTMAVLFTIGFLITGLNVQLLFVWTAFFLLLVISWIDADHGVVPDELTIIGVVIGLVGHALLGIPALLTSLWGLAIALVLGFGVRLLGRVLSGREAFGEGDITTLSLIGALLGADYVLAGLFLGSIVGLIFVAVYYLVRRELSREVKFCPFIFSGVVLYFLVSWCCNIFYII